MCRLLRPLGRGADGQHRAGVLPGGPPRAGLGAAGCVGGTRLPAQGSRWSWPSLVSFWISQDRPFQVHVQRVLKVAVMLAGRGRSAAQTRPEASAGADTQVHRLGTAPCGLVPSRGARLWGSPAACDTSPSWSPPSHAGDSLLGMGDASDPSWQPPLALLEGSAGGGASVLMWVPGEAEPPRASEFCANDSPGDVAG